MSKARCKPGKGPSVNETYTSQCLTSRCNYGIYRDIDVNICNLYSAIGTIESTGNSVYVRKLTLSPVVDWVNRGLDPEVNGPCSSYKKPKRNVSKFCPTERTKWIWEAYAFKQMLIFSDNDGTVSNPDCIGSPYRKQYAISGNDGVSRIRYKQATDTDPAQFCGYNQCVDRAGEAVFRTDIFNIYTPNQYAYNEQSFGGNSAMFPNSMVSDKWVTITDDMGIGILCFDDVIYYSYYFQARHIVDEVTTIACKNLTGWNKYGVAFQFLFRPRKIHTPDMNKILYDMIVSTKCGVESANQVPVCFEDNCANPGGAGFPNCSYIPTAGCATGTCPASAGKAEGQTQDENDSKSKIANTALKYFKQAGKVDFNKVISLEKIRSTPKPPIITSSPLQAIPEMMEQDPPGHDEPDAIDPPCVNREKVYCEVSQEDAHNTAFIDDESEPENDPQSEF